MSDDILPVGSIIKISDRYCLLTEKGNIILNIFGGPRQGGMSREAILEDNIFNKFKVHYKSYEEFCKAFPDFKKQSIIDQIVSMGGKIKKKVIIG